MAVQKEKLYGEDADEGKQVFYRFWTCDCIQYFSTMTFGDFVFNQA